MKSKLFILCLASVALLGLTGCDMTLSNLTPGRVPENPSGIYTMSVKTHIQDGEVVAQSIQPQVVIDGVAHPMKPSNAGYGIYDFDYAMPKGQSEARYYYVLDYDISRKAGVKHEQMTSKLYDLRLMNRYVVTIDSSRGPVGAKIGVVGRGFSKYDQVVFDGQEIPTTFYSVNSLSFIVPPLPAGRNYSVSVRTGEGTLPAGTFMIDSASLKVLPEGFAMISGERAVMMVSIDHAAPSGGLPINIMTNVPHSVIMPEVMIPSGSRSVSVPLEAGTAGTGTIFVSAPGFREIQVPIQVSPKPEGMPEEGQPQWLHNQPNQDTYAVPGIPDAFNPNLHD
ncbi:MAG: hypothetical protein B7X06_01955 [Verrucomicrobia bacterium 21-51-4]|nr:MAG: hypothetical protein B7X06_01955 [Verrucomicrobia bacterium 21-51-4]HQU09080.1 cell surface protein [Opitutales bacterium]